MAWFTLTASTRKESESACCLNSVFGARRKSPCSGLFFCLRKGNDTLQVTVEVHRRSQNQSRRRRRRAGMHQLSAGKICSPRRSQRRGRGGVGGGGGGGRFAGPHVV